MLLQEDDDEDRFDPIDGLIDPLQSIHYFPPFRYASRDAETSSRVFG